MRKDRSRLGSGGWCSTLREMPNAGAFAVSGSRRLFRLFERDTAPARSVERTLAEPLRRLPSRQQDCVVLRYYGDLTYAEIAHVMGIEVGTVGALLSKAHATLAPSSNGRRAMTTFDTETDRYLERLGASPLERRLE